MYYWVQRPTSITHQKVNPRYIDRADSYYLLLAKTFQKKIQFTGDVCLEKSFQDDNQREVSCVKHALPASGTPYSEKTKKANSQRVPEKQTYPLSYKTFTPQFLLHSAPVQRIHETVRDKSNEKNNITKKHP